MNPMREGSYVHYIHCDMAIGAFLVVCGPCCVRCKFFWSCLLRGCLEEQKRAYRLCSESFFRATNCADFALAYADVTTNYLSHLLVPSNSNSRGDSTNAFWYTVNVFFCSC